MQNILLTKILPVLIKILSFGVTPVQRKLLNLLIIFFCVFDSLKSLAAHLQ